MNAGVPLFRLASTCMVVAALVVVVSGWPAAGEVGSTAHELSAPDFLTDGVPMDPPPGPEPPGAPSPPTRAPTPPSGKEATPAPAEPAVTPGTLRYITPGIGETWYEGDEVQIRWEGGDPEGTVRLYFYGERCRLGGRDRGSFAGVIRGGAIPNTGSTTWTVSWLDATALNLRLAAYSKDGTLLGAIERRVRLLPREFRDLPKTCIAVSKRLQRLYYFVDGETRRMHIISTAARGYETPRMRPGVSGRRGRMGQVFYKAPNPFSSLYRVHMPYWLAITSSGSHGIHATSPNFYRLLGRPASHGCIRQHRADARVLYEMVKVGTPVYVF